MNQITLLDGGMGQELIRRSGGNATPLWATQALLDRPGLVGEVHQAYADAGATMATTNTYALHRDRLKGGSTNHYAKDGEALENLEAKHGALVTQALKEADCVRGTCRIAGSIGPLGASYRADLNPDHETAVALYGEMANLIAPHVDILLFETIASLDAARACLEAGRKTHKPVWLSFTVDDEDGTRLRSGELVADAAKIATDADAALANCSAPECMPHAIEKLAQSGRSIGAYANAFAQITKDFIKGGTTANDLSPRRDMGPKAYAAHGLKWAEMGATIIGGCCETGPDHIAELATTLTSAGFELT